MNRELEAVLKSYDAFQQTSPSEAERLGAIYQSRLDDVLQHHKGLSRQTLERMIDRKYRLWLRAQEKPASIHPKA
jgi:hypothetical protein